MSNRKKPEEYSMTPAAIKQREFLASNAGKLAPDDPRHGKASTYNRFRCKCEKCTAAWRDKCQEMKDKRLAAVKDENDPRHGTPNFYGNYGCRCERCTLAWRAVGTPRQKARRDKLAREAATTTGAAAKAPAKATPAKKAPAKAASKPKAKPAPKVEASAPVVVESVIVPAESTPVAGDSPVFLEAATTPAPEALPVKKPANPWGVKIPEPAMAGPKNPWGVKIP
jgi:hypothetical protein